MRHRLKARQRISEWSGNPTAWVGPEKEAPASVLRQACTGRRPHGKLHGSIEPRGIGLGGIGKVVDDLLHRQRRKLVHCTSIESPLERAEETRQRETEDEIIGPT